MTRQEVFDKVVDHARNQRCKALDEHSHCQYRGLNGTKCFIGAIIPDELYSDDIEYCPVDELDLDIFRKLKIRLTDKILDFLYDLQLIHDEHDVDRWDEKFKELAKRYKLKYKSQPIVELENN